MESSSLQWRRFPENSSPSLRSLHFTLVYDISRYKFDFPTECCYFQVRQKKQSTGGNILNQPIECNQKPRKRKDCIMLIHIEVYCFSVFCHERVWEPMKSICKLLSLSFVTKQKYSKSPLKIQTIHFHNLMRRPNCTLSM